MTLLPSMGSAIPWPVWAVLRRLAAFAAQQLEDGYDGHEHEELRVCQQHAKEMADVLQRAHEEPSTDELLARLPQGWGVIASHSPDEWGSYSVVVTSSKGVVTSGMGADLPSTLRAVLREAIAT